MSKQKQIKPKAMAGDVPVYCAFDKIVNIEELKPNPMNPNTHPTEQIKKLANNISSLGWRNPITVSVNSGLIVKGHGRLYAAQLLDCSEVPVDFQEYACQEDETADLIADNRIQELSVVDKKILLQCFESYDTGAVPFDLCGYTEDEYRDLASAFDEYERKPKKEEDEDEDEVDGDVEQSMKKVEFSACDYKKCCPCFGQEGCSRNK